MKYKLSDLFDLQMGKTPSRDNPEYWSQPVFPWISIADLSRAGQYIYNTKEFLSKLAVEESGIKIIPAQTVIMSFKLSIGKVSITPQPMYSNEAIMAFLDKGVAEIKPEYLYYLLLHKDWDAGTNKAVMGKTLNKATLSDVVVDIHPTEDQERIVAVLDKITSVIENYQYQLRTLDTLIKARFVEKFGDPETNSFGWEETSIGEHCFVTKLAGFEYTQYIHYEDSGDVIMVKAQNVKNGALNKKDLSYISNEVSDSLPRSQLAAGDIVMTYIGANIGDVAIIDDKHKYHLAPNVAKIRPDVNIYDSVFFMHLLMMKTSYIVSNSADTAKAALGMERIRKLRVFVPELSLQKQFAAFVSQVSKLKLSIQQSLEKLETLKQSLMQKYFG